MTTHVAYLLVLCIVGVTFQIYGNQKEYFEKEGSEGD